MNCDVSISQLFFANFKLPNFVYVEIQNWEELFSKIFRASSRISNSWKYFLEFQFQFFVKEFKNCLKIPYQILSNFLALFLKKNHFVSKIHGIFILLQNSTPRCKYSQFFSHFESASSKMGKLIKLENDQITRSGVVKIKPKRDRKLIADLVFKLHYFASCVIFLACALLSGLESSVDPLTCYSPGVKAGKTIFKNSTF